MIRKFGLKNYFCFREGAEIDFTLDKNVAHQINKSKGIGTVLGIKGANGSGKTNLIKAINFISLFAIYSSNSSKRKNVFIPIYSHFNNDSETDFYIEFENNDVIYFYEVSLTENEVRREAIYRKNRRKVLLIERINDQIVQCITELEELKFLKLRKDASFISSYKNFRFNTEMPDMEIVCSVLSNIKSNVSLIGYENIENEIELGELSKSYLDHPDTFEFIKKIIRKTDDSIKDIVVHERLNDEGEKEYFPIFLHSYKDKIEPISFTFESSGTKMLYKMLYHYWHALDIGGLLCIDEFDIHLHAMILPDILNLFLDKNTNKNGAQFLFTAHNTEIIDSLGKYRTILVNKEDGESYCYRLDEIPGSLIRNDRAITPLYLQGKIGGVPNRNG